MAKPGEGSAEQGEDASTTQTSEDSTGPSKLRRKVRIPNYNYNGPSVGDAHAVYVAVEWTTAAVSSGVVGNLAYDLLKRAIALITCRGEKENSGPTARDREIALKRLVAQLVRKRCLELDAPLPKRVKLRVGDQMVPDDSEEFLTTRHYVVRSPDMRSFEAHVTLDVDGNLENASAQIMMKWVNPKAKRKRSPRAQTFKF